MQSSSFKKLKNAILTAHVLCIVSLYRIYSQPHADQLLFVVFVCFALGAAQVYRCCRACNLGIRRRTTWHYRALTYRKNKKGFPQLLCYDHKEEEEVYISLLLPAVEDIVL